MATRSTEIGPTRNQATRNIERPRPARSFSPHQIAGDGLVPLAAPGSPLLPPLAVTEPADANALQGCG
ncbi:hypothetical protein [Streptomyces pinistramenti]|uniref:hypothetical protein n=1 Tax=Streptomyces pinistramenti TaxID=2884812 RepID=UPI001D05E722|nr:hypothetical protein [Streptomyces pinistramenti]MCB5910165.1 hypothetical protein [Streptomyces pinistramenti]